MTVSVSLSLLNKPTLSQNISQYYRSVADDAICPDLRYSYIRFDMEMFLQMAPVDTNYINTFSINLSNTASLQIDKAVAFVCRSVPVQVTK